jgi:hypothetical protein
VKPVDFDLHQPATVDEVLTLLARHADDARVLAGGQSLVPLLNFRLARPGHVIDIGRLSALGNLDETPAGLVVGAMVRQSRAERSPAVGARCSPPPCRGSLTRPSAPAERSAAAWRTRTRPPSCRRWRSRWTLPSWP